VAERSRAWLAFWRSEAGRDGFYPFDLMAAARVRDPTHFGCARVTAWVGIGGTALRTGWQPLSAHGNMRAPMFAIAQT
jgi:hypothetical protein